MIDLRKIRRGTIIKKSTLKNARGWLVLGVQRPLIDTGNTEILIQGKKGKIIRITVEEIKDIQI